MNATFNYTQVVQQNMSLPCVAGLSFWRKQDCFKAIVPQLIEQHGENLPNWVLRPELIES